jgi:apolipoprotein N-acyltransferase
VVLEYVRNIGQLAFPWSFLSTTQWNRLPLIQICDITGPWIISYFIVLVNVVIAQLVVRIINHKSKDKISGTWRDRLFSGTSLIPGIGLIFFMLCLILGYGYFRLAVDFNGDHPINIAVLQHDIPQRIKFASYAGSDEERQNLSSVLESINFDMLKELKEGDLDLVILPESAFTRSFFAYDNKIQEKIGMDARRLGAGILLGSDREVFYTKDGRLARTREEIDEINAYNSAWYFLPNGKLYPESYDKIQLVPFGEHLPYFDLIPGFQRIIVQTGSFSKGKNYTLFPLYKDAGSMGQAPDYSFSTVICFESSFGWLLRRFVKKGADFLIIITNDGWYEDSAGPYQHFILSVIRAVETRRWIVRCSNRGVSALISPRGEIFHQTQLNKKETIIGKIYPRKNRTFYGMTGDLMILPYLIPLAAAIAGILKKRKSKQRQG